jgi:hypothetical protein
MQSKGKSRLFCFASFFFLHFIRRLVARFCLGNLLSYHMSHHLEQTRLPERWTAGLPEKSHHVGFEKTQSGINSEHVLKLVL